MIGPFLFIFERSLNKNRMQKIKEFTVAELKELVKEKNLLEFNRDISDIHTKKMQDSIMDCGLLRLPVIGELSKFDKNRKYAIIDGQHLCSAIVKLPRGSIIKKVNCIIKTYSSKKEVIADISKLNNTQKTWNDENYLDAWFKFGKDNIEHFKNYAYLQNLYSTSFDGLPCGFLVDLYAKSKDDFKEGALEFRDREFSDKLAQISIMLKEDYKKGSFTLHGLRMWAMNRKFNEKKDIDFHKLKSRLSQAIRNKEDSNCNGRDDFREFVKNVLSNEITLKKWEEFLVNIDNYITDK